MNAEKEKQHYYSRISELWNLIKLTIDKYGNKEMSDEDWGSFIEDGQSLSRKYSGDKFVCEIVVAWLEEFERRKAERE